MTNSTHTRTAAAAGLVLGALLFTLGDLLRRLVLTGAASATAITAAVGRHGGTWAVAGLLSAAAGFCLVAGAIGLIASARGRGARITTVGAIMLAVGALAAVGHAVAFYAPYALYNRARIPGPELTSMDRASQSYPLLLALILLFILGMVLGPIVLFVGLRRARRVPIWSLVAAVVFVVTGSTSSVSAGVLGVVAALMAFVPAARSLTTAEPTATPDLATATAAT